MAESKGCGPFGACENCKGSRSCLWMLAIAVLVFIVVLYKFVL